MKNYLQILGAILTAALIFYVIYCYQQAEALKKSLKEMSEIEAQ